MHTDWVRKAFLQSFEDAGFRQSKALSLLQPSIATSFLFSVGFVDVMQAIEGNSVELDRAATVQRCFRHFDIERVSDSRHLSFFEMAGALRCSEWKVEDLVLPLIQFYVDVCHIPRERMHVTYFGGGEVKSEFMEEDHRARDAYVKSGICESNIWAGSSSTNIWFEGANSGTPRSGICGPHSEVFVDLSKNASKESGKSPLTHGEEFIEISNLVTITHHARENSLIRLPTPIVEQAVGMERLEMVITGSTNVHETPKLSAIRNILLGGSSISDTDGFSSALCVATDHVRAITHLIADGARPGPKGRGHVLRRLFRRLLHVAGILKFPMRSAFPELAQTIARVDQSINPNLLPEMTTIQSVFDREVRRMSEGKVIL